LTALNILPALCFLFAGTNNGTYFFVSLSTSANVTTVCGPL